MRCECVGCSGLSVEVEPGDSSEVKGMDVQQCNAVIAAQKRSDDTLQSAVFWKPSSTGSPDLILHPADTTYPHWRWRGHGMTRSFTNTGRYCPASARSVRCPVSSSGERHFLTVDTSSGSAQADHNLPAFLTRHLQRSPTVPLVQLTTRSGNAEHNAQICAMASPVQRSGLARCDSESRTTHPSLPHSHTHHRQPPTDFG